MARTLMVTERPRNAHPDEMICHCTPKPPHSPQNRQEIVTRNQSPIPQESVRARRLQDVSSKTDETSKASTGCSERLAGGTSEGGSSSIGAGRVGDVLRWWGRNIGGFAGRAAGVGSNTDNWLGDRARAVGDGQGGSLGDSVGNIVMGDNSRARAVGSVGSDDLGHIRGVAVVGGGTSGQGERSSSDGGEAHFDVVIRYLRGGKTESRAG